MAIILIANQKGGVGKSSSTCNIASVLAQKGKDVLIVDADRQSTAAKWSAEREISNPSLPVINCAQKYGAINNTLQDFDRRYEYVLVDVSGRDSDEMRSAMVVADILLMPYKPSQPDLDTLPNMSDIIKKSRWINEKLVPHAFLSIAPTNAKIKELAWARIAILEYQEINLLNTVIHDRKVYRDAMGDGIGVIEMTGKGDSEISSRNEMFSLVKEILNV